MSPDGINWTCTEHPRRNTHQRALLRLAHGLAAAQQAQQPQARQPNQRWQRVGAQVLDALQRELLQLPAALRQGGQAVCRLLVVLTSKPRKHLHQHFPN
jgi:hypothetical protein